MSLFNVLAVGDVFAKPGREFLLQKLPGLKQELGVHFCIVNGENCADTNGISREGAAELFQAGADVITTGNHAFQRGTAVYENERVLRPANYHAGLPGRGFCVVDCGPVSVQVISLAGAVFMDHTDNPFEAAKRCLAQRDGAAITIIDFHAEATSEKRALAEFFDGEAGLVFGTHTHVLTADEKILKKGTAFITDIGMTGPIDSVIGITAKSAIDRICYGLYTRPEPAAGGCMLNGVFVQFERNGKAVAIRRICIT